MKAIAVSVSSGRSICRFFGEDIRLPRPPMIAVPTTAGTGSEATRFTVITDTESRAKLLLKGRALLPDLAVVDPSLCSSVPPQITAYTGMDALTHAIEAYTSRLAQPLTDAVCLSAVRRSFRFLARAYEDGSDAEACGELAIAALEAGIAINNASVTLVHGMSRPLGALFHVPHGLSNAMLLPSCLRFALSGAEARFAELARVIGAAEREDRQSGAAEKLIGAVQSLCRRVRIPSPAEYGIDRGAYFAAIDRMTDEALRSGSPANTVRPVTGEEIAAIYRGLW